MHIFSFYHFNYIHLHEYMYTFVTYIMNIFLILENLKLPRNRGTAKTPLLGRFYHHRTTDTRFAFVSSSNIAVHLDSAFEQSSKHFVRVFLPLF